MLAAVPCRRLPPVSRRPLPAAAAG